MGVHINDLHALIFAVPRKRVKSQLSQVISVAFFSMLDIAEKRNSWYNMRPLSQICKEAESKELLCQDLR
mgnify:CR=1 FL=1